MRYFSCFCLFTFLSISYSWAQVVELNILSEEGCNYSGETYQSGPIYGFAGSDEASNTINEIVQYVGLAPNFVIKAANVPNAMAYINQGQRYILYSQQFMDDIYRRTGNYWSRIAILAHEIGHHLNGHTLDDRGSRPVLELEADQFSGFVLYKMGANLEQAKSAVQTVASVKGSSTHPARNARLEAVAVGFHRARELLGSKAAQPSPTPARPSFDALAGVRVRPATILDPGKIMSTLSFSTEPELVRALKDLGFSSSFINNTLIPNSHEKSWPPSIKGLGDRLNNPDQLKAYTVFLVVTSKNQSILWVPAQANQYMAPGYRPSTDFFIPIQPAGITVE